MTVLEDFSEQCLDMMSKLLQHMDKATIITSDQMKAVRYIMGTAPLLQVAALCYRVSDASTMT